MLGADLALARAKDGELVLRRVDKKTREEARALAARYLEAARAHVGRRREELEEAWNDVDADAAAGRRKLALGLRKLVEDACTFEAEAPIDPVAARRAVFTRAATARRRAAESGAVAEARFDRAAVIGQAAASLGVSPEDLERALFADLRGEHVLRVAPSIDAAGLVEQWELARAQAILLTAVRVTCDVRSASPGLLRAFFAKLKFHQLLFTAERTDEGWRVVLDGPYSMFDAVTKYGLRLALVLPAVRTLERWSITADVRWGKAREPLVFRIDGRDERRGEAEGALHLSDDVRDLLDGVASAGTPWRARPATAILDVPGLGVCIPDLELRRGEGPPVWVEVLGFWSRDAVWRRIELARRGLGGRVVFVVSSRLRVSSETIGDDLPASLYVYKGRISARALIDHVERVAQRPGVTA
jgi:hypothetical protein